MKPMSRAAIAKYLYEVENYTIRQTAIISEFSEDYIRKLIAHQRSKDVGPSFEGITDGMLRRKNTIDKVMSLQGCYFVMADQKYCYISLLSYMGFALDELQMLFPTDNRTFLRVAALRSAGAWKRLDSAVLGIAPEDFSYTFLEHDSSWEPQSKEAEKENEDYLKWRQEQRKAQKLLNKSKIQRKNR